MNIFGIRQKEFPGAVARIDFPIAHSVGKGKKLFEEGYKYNVVVFRCTDSIIKAAKTIDIRIKENDNYLDDSNNQAVKAVFKVLKKPNPKQYWGSFITEAFINWLILGEMFLVTAEDRDRVPQELWNLDPLEMHIKPGRGLPQYYEQKVTGQTVRWDVDQITGDSQVFFWKGHNPTDKWRGMSPLHAAALAADTNNAALRWNFSMLKKGGRLSGLVKFKASGPNGEQEIGRFRKWVKDIFQGEYNAGKVGFLTNDADFIELGKNPKEMDYIKTVDKTTAFIAMAYGVPLPLVLNEAATFNNYREAKELFYTDTVLPLFQEFLESFGGWLLPKFGLENATLEFDEDSIPALESMRERRNERMAKLVEKGIISPDEAREELGYQPRGGMAEELYMPASSIPIDDFENNDSEETTAIDDDEDL